MLLEYLGVYLIGFAAQIAIYTIAVILPNWSNIKDHPDGIVILFGIGLGGGILWPLFIVPMIIFSLTGDITFKKVEEEVDPE